MSIRICSLVITGWEVAVARAASPELSDVPVIIEAGGRVWCASPEAAEDGVRAGMVLREAQTCSPAAIVVERDAKLAFDEFEEIVEAIEELTPAVEVSAPGELAFRASGAVRAYGSERELLDRIFSVAPVVPALASPGSGGVRVGASIARGRFTATMAARVAAARGGPGRVEPNASGLCTLDPMVGPPASYLVIDDGDERDFLVPFPIGVLGAEIGAPDLPETLMLLGIETLGDFAALPAASVAARFGEPGQLGHALSCGSDDRPLLLRSPSEPLVAACELDPPVSGLDELTFVAKSLADQLGAEMERRILSAAVLRAEGVDESGNVHTASWRSESGVVFAAERARWHLESWNPDGGLVEMRIFPVGVGAQSGRQLRLTGVGGAIDPAAEIRAERAVARLQAVLGPSGALEVTTRGGRLPSERTLLSPVAGTPASAGDVSGEGDLPDRRGDPFSERLSLREAGKGPRRYAPWPGSLPAPSPALLRDGPISVSLADKSLPEGQPAGLDGVPAYAAAGPFRYRLRWWNPPDLLDAEVWQLLLEDGTAALVSRRVDGGWSLEGIYD